MSGMDQDKCSNCSVSEVFDSDYLLFFDTIAVSSLGGQQYDPRNVTNRDGAIIDLSVSSTNKNLVSSIYIYIYAYIQLVHVLRQ